MLEILPESRERRFYVKAEGRLTDADYKRLTPLLDDAIRTHGPIRMFIDLTAFEGWEPRAAWDDFVLGIRHWNDFERVALVGDKAWEDVAARVMSHINRGEFRFFHAEHASEARTWIESV